MNGDNGDKSTGKLLRYGVAGLSGGAGVTLAVAAIEAVKAHPDFLPQLLNGGVLTFVALMFGMVIISRQGKSFIRAHAEGVKAQQLLAMNVGSLVSHDGEREREQELLVNHMAAQYQEILDHLRALRREQDPT